jgi:hypothetical protein
MSTKFLTSFLLFLGVFGECGLRIDHHWQADLVDLAKLSSYNKGFKYLLTYIDVLSRYQWVVLLTDKTGRTLKDAFQVIFKSGRRPIRLQTDKGTEFINRVFQMFLKEHDMHFFTTYNEENPLNPPATGGQFHRLQLVSWEIVV